MHPFPCATLVCRWFTAHSPNGLEKEALKSQVHRGLALESNLQCRNVRRHDGNDLMRTRFVPFRKLLIPSSERSVQRTFQMPRSWENNPQTAWRPREAPLDFPQPNLRMLRPSQLSHAFGLYDVQIQTPVLGHFLFRRKLLNRRGVFLCTFPVYISRRDDFTP